MTLWTKICANTSLADAQIAADAGASAVGFVFAPSPRRVSAEQVAGITPHLPASLEKIGVFVDASLETIAATVRHSGLTGVQLHFDADPDLPAQLRQTFGPTLRILRVIHFSASALDQLQNASTNPNLDAILIDSRSATAVGGTGIPFDWIAARSTMFSHAGHLKLIAAGGLNPGNVAQAVALLRPWGVDVASGVESTPGLKDPAKVQQFLASAKAAAAKTT